jgi:hypothetical protein
MRVDRGIEPFLEGMSYKFSRIKNGPLDVPE